MVNQRDTAKKISELMLDTYKRLDESVSLVRKTGTDEEFETYRAVIGEVLGRILINILNPLYSIHPSLRPPGLDTPSSKGRKSSQ
jgi:hypothetical protein